MLRRRIDFSQRIDSPETGKRQRASL